ncbi:acyl-CoA dehydrogenase-related protein [Dorcoceras hygrometricum]|uniref:Acyl-CoA dehydrogenase-related protein n=1 Tax=Dorcoceras hygrometricum TaxID=472368 RepID=A0A2Z7AFK8_9LAMI|nr:acyl-CoA dehydrogenase-related protein [Dorcoceras hygrometricum]
MSLFDLQDVCIAVRSLATLDLLMVVDLIGIYGLKGPYCTCDSRPLPSSPNAAAAAARCRRKFIFGQLDEENPFVQNSSVLLVQPDEGVSDLVVDRIGVTTAIYREEPGSCNSAAPPPPPPAVRRRRRRPPCAAAAASRCRRKFVSGQLDEENPFMQNSSVLLVQPDEGVSVLVVDRIGDYLPQSTEKSRVLVIPVGARHKCQQDVCMAIGSIATLDLPMVVDLIGIYGLKGSYCTLTTTNWFLQALSVIPRGSWGDVARRFTMIRWASLEL